MRIDLMAAQEVGDGMRDTHLSQTDVEYLPDFAELLLNFARAVGYTYVNQVILIKDDGSIVETLRWIKATYVDHAYAAGFLEADGCIHITKNTACIRVVNRNTAVLFWLKERYGGEVRSKVKPEGCWEWNIHSDGAIRFMDQVYEHLLFKKPQADLFYEFFKTRQKRGVPLPEKVVKLREDINDRMKKEKAQWRA